MGTIRRAGFAAAIAAVQVGLAYQFALAYRVRAGYPRRNVPNVTPADLGLAYKSLTVESDGLDLPAWFIPARGGAAGPAVVLVHGWESARDRTLPMAHLPQCGWVPLPDVRRSRPRRESSRELPLSAGEFGSDALAAFGATIARPEVTVAAISGHSMGGIGAILAAGADPRVAAVVATSTPAGPYRLTRQTFRLARLPIPDPIAYPLAWLTTRVYLRPRGHAVRSVSAVSAIGRYAGPVLLAHGEMDTVVPSSHMDRLAIAARAGKAARSDPAPVETVLVPAGQHSWLYEDAGYRRAVARFLTAALGGPLDPEAQRRPRLPHLLSGSPRARAGSQRWRRRTAGCEPLPRSRCPARRAGRLRRPRPRRPRGPATVRVAIVTDPVTSPVWSAVSRKRAIRQFADRPLRADHLDRILQAGRRSGSSKNLQRWTFIVCRDRDHLEELAALGPWAGHVAGAARQSRS